MSVVHGMPPQERRVAVLGTAAFTALFLGVHLVLAVAPDGLTPADVVELVLVAAAASTLVRPRALPAPAVIGCVLCLLTAASMGIWALPPVAHEPDYRSWVLGAVTFVALGLTLRTRYLEAWLTLLCVGGVAVGWSVDAGLGPFVGAGLVVRHVGTLLAGTLLSVALDRSARSASAFEAAERHERAAAEAARARQAARQAAAREVLEQAGPMLGRLAEGSPLSDADRRELLVLEGTLRDRIRAAGLLRGDLPERVAAARRRGMDVLLLDETEGLLGDGEQALAAAWLSERIPEGGAGRLVGRLASRDGVARVTVVTDGGADALVLAPAAERPRAPVGGRAGRGRARRTSGSPHPGRSS